ncbi:unnamed protein product [Sphagnum tenellum]
MNLLHSWQLVNRQWKIWFQAHVCTVVAGAHVLLLTTVVVGAFLWGYNIFSRKYRIKHDQTQCSPEQSAAGHENRMTNCKSMEVMKAAAAALNQQTDHHPVVLIEPTAMGSPCLFDSARDVSTYVQQQQQRELNPAVDEEKEQLTTQEEEKEEEEMSMIMTEDESEEFPSSTGAIAFASSVASAVGADAATAMTQRMKERKRERMAYLFAAVASSVGFVTLAAGAVYYRFIWQMEDNGEVPYGEMLGTFSLAIGAAVGMEFWARWAHQALWHASLWNMHESHHKPRQGPFELNDIFAIINAVPAITLMAIGFFNHGFVPGLCFGGGLGITMFGMAYMFVHDGLVHQRFAVGPIADFPYLQKVAAAHQLHHADLFGGVPYGLFLGPKELEEVGGQDELQKVLNVRYKNREGDREG